MLGDRYHETIVHLLDAIHQDEGGSISNAAELISHSIATGGLLHVFGPGHSAILAKEVTTRAGGLVPVNQIIDHAEGIAERLPGYAAYLLDTYDAQYGLHSGESLIVISNSGINPLPIEVAMGGTERGLHVIAMTNVSQSKSAQSRHPSGKRLLEVADVVLDTHAVPGDAAVDVPTTSLRSGATSTVAGAFLINLVMLATIERLQDRGVTVPVLMSQNVPGGDDWNRRLLETYRARIRRSGA